MLDHPQGDSGGYRGPVGRIELVQCSGEAIVAKERIRRLPQQPAVESFDPFGQLIQRLPPACDIPCQYQECIDGGTVSLPWGLMWLSNISRSPNLWMIFFRIGISPIRLRISASIGFPPAVLSLVAASKRGAGICA